MFEHIAEIIPTVAISLAVTIMWLALVQSSKYTEHKKAHIADPESDAKQLTQKFAYVPYALIPLIGALISVFVGLAGADYSVAHGYIASTESVIIASAIFSLVVYAILDYKLISHVGDQAYFRLIESRLYKSVEDVPKSEKALNIEELDESELVVLLSKLLKK